MSLARIFFYIFQSFGYRIFGRPRKSVRGEICLITGGSMGIGKGMAEKLSKRGATLVLLDINEEKLNETVAELRAAGGKAYGYVCDVTDRERVYELAKIIEKEVGYVTILINNAGIVTGRKLLDALDTMIEKTIAVNTTALAWTVKAFLPRMLEQNHGHLVTIASTAGTTGVNGLADYCASKFGAFGFHESIRFEIKAQNKTGVHTTCICPYYINTGMFTGVKTRFPWILPILEPEYMVARIIKAIETNDELVIAPAFCWLTFLCRTILPVKVYDEVMKFLGVTDSMQGFAGHKHKKIHD